MVGFKSLFFHQHYHIINSVLKMHFDDTARMQSVKHWTAGLIFFVLRCKMLSLELIFWFNYLDFLVRLVIVFRLLGTTRLNLITYYYIITFFHYFCGVLFSFLFFLSLYQSCFEQLEQQIAHYWKAHTGKLKLQRVQ